MTINEALERYFGYSSFRPGQKELVEAILEGRDVIGVMPTGAGKSVCFQTPAMILPGLTIVISPLISLMKDQVAALVTRGIPAAFLNSSLTDRQAELAMTRAKSGAYKIIYVAPERLDTARFFEFASESDISLIAVDEAHCISQWGHEFRPSYLKISDFISRLGRRPVVAAFTATATPYVKSDIISSLRLTEPLSVTTGFDRPNLRFDVLKKRDKIHALIKLVKKHSPGTGIVYCGSRKTTEDVAEKLAAAGISTAHYHAGMEARERGRNQDLFLKGEIQVLSATNAFGMGIDKPDVRFVIHYNMPKDLESYYQEAGRAGRDGNPSDCILLFSEKDIDSAEWLIKSRDNAEAGSIKYDKARLKHMIAYSRSRKCYRRVILEYFGEKPKKSCGNCGNCK